MDELDGIFKRVVSVLNSSVDGEFIYGGTRTNVPPVNISDLDDLAALASVDDAFENNTLKRSVAVDDGVVVEFGFAASDLARDLFQQFKDIKDFHDGSSGPLTGDLTAVKSDFLTGLIPGSISVHQGLTAQVAINGRSQNTISDAIIRHEEETVHVKEFISSIEDVDLAEAVSRLNLNQIQTEATARVLSQLSRISLLDYI